MRDNLYRLGAAVGIALALDLLPISASATSRTQTEALDRVRRLRVGSLAAVAESGALDLATADALVSLLRSSRRTTLGYRQCSRYAGRSQDAIKTATHSAQGFRQQNMQKLHICHAAIYGSISKRK